MEKPELGRAKAAATSVAASLGLPVDDAIVLQNSNKLGLRLTPGETFARVAPVGLEVSQFEVELAQRLAEVGSPVCPLEPPCSQQRWLHRDAVALPQGRRTTCRSGAVGGGGPGHLKVKASATAR